MTRNSIYSFDVVGGTTNITNRVPKYMSSFDVSSGDDKNWSVMSYLASVENLGLGNIHGGQQT